MADTRLIYSLTPTERQVLWYIEEELSYQQIGVRLNLHEATVTLHFKSIYQKIGIDTSTTTPKERKEALKDYSSALRDLTNDPKVLPPRRNRFLLPYMAGLAILVFALGLAFMGFTLGRRSAPTPEPVAVIPDTPISAPTEIPQQEEIVTEVPMVAVPTNTPAPTRTPRTPDPTRTAFPTLTPEPVLFEYGFDQAFNPLWIVIGEPQVANGNFIGGEGSSMYFPESNQWGNWASPRRMDTKLRSTYNQLGDHHEREAEEIQQTVQTGCHSDV